MAVFRAREPLLLLGLHAIILCSSSSALLSSSSLKLPGTGEMAGMQRKGAALAQISPQLTFVFSPVDAAATVRLSTFAASPLKLSSEPKCSLAASSTTCMFGRKNVIIPPQTRLPFPQHIPSVLTSKMHRTRLFCQDAVQTLPADEGMQNEQNEVGETEGLTRKERRRLNRKARNRTRNRLAGPDGEGSIARKEALSQNFLEDPSIIAKFVEAVEDRSRQGGCVVELGPGLGALTEPLLEEYPKMTAVELDGQAAGELRKRLPGLTLHEGSMLDFDFEALAKERGQRLTVISNVPFGISSSLLFKLLDNSHSISRAVLLLQQEVVNRILAEQDQRKYSTLSVEFYLRAARMQQLFIVPSIAFNPPPRNTKTAVVAIDFAKEPPLDEVDGQVLRHTLQAAFADKGKVLEDSIWKSRELKKLIPDIRDICQTVDYNWLKKRPSELSVGRWLHIARALSAYVEGELEEGGDEEEKGEELSP